MSNLFAAYHKRNAHLREAGYDGYGDYLKSAEWKAIRSIVLRQFHYKCWRCGKKAHCLHHAVYNPGSMNGTNVAALVPLCQPCHQFGEMDGDRKCSLDEANTRLGIQLSRKCSDCGHHRPWHTFTYFGDTRCRSCAVGKPPKAEAPRRKRIRHGKGKLLGGPLDGEKFMPPRVKGRGLPSLISIERDGQRLTYQYDGGERAYTFKAQVPLPDPSGRVVTEAIINAMQTEKGGWSKESLARLGVAWPPRKGWRQDIIGKPMPG